MPYLVGQDAPTAPLMVQPTLRAGDQCCSLRPGAYALGGRAGDAVPLAALAGQPRAAMLAISADGTAVLQRTTAAIMVRLDGETLGIAPVELHHGATIEFGDCRVTYEGDASGESVPARRRSDASVASAAIATGATTGTTEVRVLSLAGSFAGPNAERATDAALVNVRSGARFPIPVRRIYVGRDESCDVVVGGSNVSRRHVSIVPVVGGFMLRNESANGTQVNGVRVVGTYLLGDGDVVRIQDEELRVELDGSAAPPAFRGDKTTLLDLSHIMPGVSEEEARAAANRALVASLEIVRGPFTGACFQVERAVCSIGRAEENDVRIRDDTVSFTHATLLRKRGAWFVVDLRSMNGTFVDGSRVSGERELHPGARLRLGTVELIFRALGAEAPPPVEPSRARIWTRVRQWMRSVSPPIRG